MCEIGNLLKSVMTILQTTCKERYGQQIWQLCQLDKGVKYCQKAPDDLEAADRKPREGLQ